MQERRDRSRVDLNHPISLQIDDQQVRGLLCNLSLQGALVSLGEENVDEVDADLLEGDALAFQQAARPRTETTVCRAVDLDVRHRGYLRVIGRLALSHESMPPESMYTDS